MTARLILYFELRSEPPILTVRCYGYPPTEITPEERAGNADYEASRAVMAYS